MSLTDNSVLQFATDLWSKRCQQLEFPVPLEWLLFLALSAPHFLYAWIWLFPHVWKGWFGQQSVELFATTAGFLKGLQFYSVAGWVWANHSTGLCFQLASIALWQWLAFLLLFVFGQTLNLAVFKALGKAGVYYGTKLGHRIPWHDGFPFDIVPHPQYVGSALSVWGTYVLIYNQLAPEAVIVPIFWTVCYAVTAYIESL